MTQPSFQQLLAFFKALADAPRFRSVGPLADRFEFNRRYPELEVNAFIGQQHDDCATLRRELTGAKLMHRESSVYWRPAPPAGLAL